MMNRIQAAVLIHKRMTNSILNRYAKPASVDSTKKQRDWSKVSDIEKQRIYLAGPERTEITEADLEGKTPAEQEELKLKLIEYKKQFEQEKIERDRLKEDKMMLRGSADNKDETTMGYYQRQILERMEHITGDGRARNPLKQENKSNAMHPYSFYGDLTEWKSLDQALNICRVSHDIKNTRQHIFHSRSGKRLMAARHKTDRIDLLRKQYLSGEAFVQKFPAAVQPYLLLSRYDKPIGYQLLFFPGAISILAGTPYACTPDLSLMAIFAAGTLLTRGAGCTINDIWDRKLDAEVERCKSRPLPAGLVTVDQAKVWFVVQMAAAFGLLTCLNWNTFMLGLVAPIPIMLYPLAKRANLPQKWKQNPVLSLLLRPQVALGLTFNWGAMMGYTAATGSMNLAVQVPLYLSMVSWTIFYDTIYAKQDLEDDRKLGLNTSADFSNLVPPEQRKRGVESTKDVFVTHRQRQKVRAYQDNMEYRTLVGLVFTHIGLFHAFMIAAESDGSLNDVGMSSAAFVLAAMNWQWMKYGTTIGKDNGNDSIRAKDFFIRQKWYGLFLFTLVLLQSGFFYAWR